MHFNIADLFESLADAIPDRRALVSGDEGQTFAELDRKTNRAAHALQAAGIRPGDHIGMYLYNCGEFVELMLAAFKLRAVPINLNYRYVEEELRYVCAQANLKAIVFDAEQAPRVQHVRPKLPKLETLISIGGPVDGAVEYDDFIAGRSEARDFGPRSGDDLYIIYTGGTTGMPRGVMWRQEDLFFAGLQGGSPGGDPCQTPEQVAEQAKDPDKAMVMMPAAPLIHGAAQFSIWIAMFTGGKGVLATGRHFRSDELFRLIEREKVNTMTIVGDAMAQPLAEALEKSPDRWDLSSLIVIASAGAILSQAVRERLQVQLQHAMILDNFGSSETGHQGSAISDPTLPRASFFMNEFTAVLDENLKPLEPGCGVIGKVARRGRIPLGYYNDAEKTAATFVTIDGVRWVIPGDFARLEDDGRVTLLGRGAVCINTGGEKVYPEEIENALKAFAGVRDAIVVGVPDARWGERVAAVVEPNPGHEPTLAQLVEHLREHVAGYKTPRELHLVDRVVRHPSGKPDYKWAREVATREPSPSVRGEGEGDCGSASG